MSTPVAKLKTTIQSIYRSGQTLTDVFNQIPDKEDRDIVRAAAKARGKQTLQFIYDLCYGGAPVCPVCKTNKANWRAGKYTTFCSNRCQGRSPDTQRKKQATCLANHGVAYPQQSASVRKKSIKTYVKTLGVDNPSRSPVVKRKRTKTMKERFGVRNAFSSDDIRCKIRATLLERYGVEHPMHSPEIVEKLVQHVTAKYGAPGFASPELMKRADITTKRRHGYGLHEHTEEREEARNATSLARYGFKHYTQSPAFKDHLKSVLLEKYGVDSIAEIPGWHDAVMQRRYKAKWVKLGKRRVAVYGYEDHAIRYLLDKGVSPADILVMVAEGKPTIPYVHEGVRRVYIPDFYVKLKGSWWVVEVKSTYTAGVTDVRLFNTMKRKLAATEKAGLKTALLVFSPSGTLLFRHTDSVAALSRKRMVKGLTLL